MRYAFLVACAALAAVSAPAQIAPGGPLPLADRALPTVAGTAQSLGSLAGPNGLVVVFWSNTCPWGDRYAGRVAELAATYGPAGIPVVLVNSSAPDRLEAESAESGRAELAAAGLAVPYLLDADGGVARAFGARSAPHAFLFGPGGALLYDGALDDSPSSADRVERAYLREALDQAVAGLPVPVQKTLPFGCRLPGAAAPDVAPPSAPAAP